MNESIKQGWVRIYRKSLDSSVWKNPNIWFVWSWCMLKANHSDNVFPFNNQDMLVKRGSFITGLLSAQKELPTLSLQNIRTAFTYLKSTGRITIQSNNKFSVITIVKWEDYQLDNRLTNNPLTNEQQTSNKPVTTNKNDKKEKNDKEERYIDVLTPPSEELIKEMTEKYNCSPSQVKQKCDAIINYCDSKGKKYKDYKAVLRTWLNKDFGLKKIDLLLINNQKQ